MIVKAVAVAVTLLPSFSSAVPAAPGPHAWHAWSLTGQVSPGAEELPVPRITTPGSDTATTVDFGTAAAATRDGSSHPPSTRQAPQPSTLLWLGLVLGLLPFGLRRRNQHREPRPSEDRLQRRRPR